MQPFRTHTGEIVSGAPLQAALDTVAAGWRRLAYAIRSEDAYAAHVSEESKDTTLAEMLVRADAIQAGDIASFTIWQRVNEALTGECVALFSDECAEPEPEPAENYPEYGAGRADFEHQAMKESES